MKKRTVLIAAVACVAAVAIAQQVVPIKRTMLQKQELTADREVVMAQADIAAGGLAARHTHPGVEAGYVLEGQMTLEVEGEAARQLKAGDSFSIPYGRPHAATVTADGPAKIVSTYVVEKGKPLATPAPK
jgi:quercetin dioxygenase-like cupin family protein